MKRPANTYNKEEGLSLIELLIVVAILAVISGAVVSMTDKIYIHINDLLFFYDTFNHIIDFIPDDHQDS